MKYRKKPVVIEAFRIGYEIAPQWFVDSDDCIPTWDTWLDIANSTIQPGKAIINTLEGHMTAAKGDYVIQGIKGEIYPCKSDIFLATYEAADE